MFEFLKKWAQEERQDLPSIVRKLSFIGITWRAKNSPNTWRWQQKANWIEKYPKITVKNVSVPGRLWDYLGNLQFKVAKTNYPERWGSEEIMSPPREERNLKALKQAHQIYSVGLSQKREFAEKLSLTQEFKEGWLRSLTQELKGIA
ncbi:hypothetical protein [Microbulbifer guangxiensis]|uniref:hypothetical protein n=1 Tax=Microbulbifer guangxiensis TaxID=2904249 RepID=UPI001F20A5F1|nr:hypothetical protein [Microbulbifer guangxiensis]